MTDDKFIGRGEVLTIAIINKLFERAMILPQCPLEKLISPTEFENLDSEIQKHKFDFVMVREKHDEVVVEVNYKHGEKAARKWNNIFVPLLKKHGQVTVAINDYDCRNLFKLGSDGHHKLAWDDFRDVIDALEQAGVKPQLDL